MSKQTNKSKSNTRRTVLKSAGVVGAASVWHKPILNAVATPVHAQSSVVTMVQPTTVGGSSSSTSPTGSTGLNRFQNIAQRAGDALIPEAHAGTEAHSPITGPCAAFVRFQDDYTHCIVLELADGSDPNGEVQVTLTGPEVYYDYDCSVSGTYYYRGSVNFSGSGTATMTDGSFMLSLGAPGDDGVDISGSFNEALDAATGTLVYQGTSANISQQSSGAYYCTDGDNRGAFWAADLANATCSPGSGINTSNVVVDPQRQGCT